ncbi:RDD family protein [Hyphobacterium sp. HN65]|uniref:RDD family protein n=1 Tax=Hyphobacterium lacteum TaxID=3116575 RepID=A0ABU7LP65_9PROT|nr:RDD family protein [Hyphobacterium sp. HN65]MEE2525673.1 RDD family protein [Hyphobacterium sp. HN65]
MARARNPAEAARQEAAGRRFAVLTPPEGVPIRFEIASLMARMGAQIADILLTVLAALAITFFIGLMPFPLVDFFTGVLFALLLLAIRAPYYILSELFWNGQTLGKKMTGLRVLSADGRGLTTHGVVARNMMKEAEVFLPGTMLLAAGGLGAIWTLVLLVWIAILLIVPLTNRKRQRLGDILANTYVVRQPKIVLLPDLSASTQADEFSFTPAQLDHYGRFELQTLETLLRANPLDKPVKAEMGKTITEVAAQIAKKIGFDETIPEGRALAFLHAFYTAQRAFLEQKQLFGEVRADKHHDHDNSGSPNR